MAAVTVDWSDLPEGLMELIMDRLEHHGPDIVRCQAVCSSWRLAAQHVLNTRRRSVPWMLIADRHDPCSRTLLNIHTQQSRPIHLPELHDRWICTAANGWLLTIGLSRPYAMHLLNPVSREEVSLPLRSTFLHPQLDGDDPQMDGEDEMYTYMPDFIRSAALSTTPSDPNCVVLVIYGMRNNLALCKPGDEAWTHVEDPTEIANYNLMFYEVSRKFYAADNLADVKELELPLNKVSRIASPPEEHIDQKYLAESLVSGDLWMVVRNVEYLDSDRDPMWYNTLSFIVYKVDLVSKEMSRVDCLGEEALFLGQNASISVIVDGAATPGWCRPNCIYFLDDYLEGFPPNDVHRGDEIEVFPRRNTIGCYDMGVFDLATMRVHTEELASMPVQGKELRSRICPTTFHWIHLN